jgi:thiamine-monophosphate kinase
MARRSDPDGAQSGEFERIRTYFRPLATHPGAFDLTDDAAVLGVPPGRELVVTTDAMVAGVHFLADDPPADIAAKLLRVNLSDLAAMAAEPFGYSLVTSLPRSLPDAWLAAFTAGLAADQAAFDVPLLGGDSVATAGPVTLVVSMLGLVPTGQALRRAGARAGDLLLVSGTIGDGALGLKVAVGTLRVSPGADAFLLDRLRRPMPRLALSPVLRGRASAGLDVSDGLAADVGHICEVSRVAAVIEAARVPRSPAAAAALAADPRLLASMLTGGDDYELAFTAPAGSVPEIERLAAAAGVPVTVIGRIEAGPPGRVQVLGDDGRPLALAAAGWTHF